MTQLQPLPAALQAMVATRQVSENDARAFLAGLAPSEEFSGDKLLRWVAGEYQVPFSTLEGVEPDPELLAQFPARYLVRDKILPLRRDGEWVEIATSSLFATEAIDGLRVLTGLRLRPVLASPEAIQREMKRLLGVGAETLDSLEGKDSLQVLAENQVEDNDLDEAAEDASIIGFVNQILKDAIDLRASDIHLEPFEHEMRIRYRIDGELQEIPVPPQIKRFQPAIVARVKILSHLNIAEKRLPQDGRIKVRIEDYEVDIRVSIIPMLHGEAVVMRLLRQNSALRGVRDLGLGSREFSSLNRVLRLPHGIVLVTGPTGSGKTSTLYTALNEINGAERKIITIEDPVEYQLKGINQIQVSDKAGLSFAKGLRSILRHDPDVILIGEIRDEETAQIAVQASLTGHLVFSTLHTNDAPGAVTRLVDMGVEPYLVASSLESVLAQRLVRVLCPHCRAVDSSAPARSFAAKAGFDPEVKLYKAVGCRECRNTGYFGRHAIFEWMDVDEEMREMILKSASTDALAACARRKGMRTLAQDGFRLIAEGITTLDEVLGVTTHKEIDFGFAPTPSEKKA